jgi:hypothetical protein
MTREEERQQAHLLGRHLHSSSRTLRAATADNYPTCCSRIIRAAPCPERKAPSSVCISHPIHRNHMLGTSLPSTDHGPDLAQEHLKQGLWRE